MNLAGRTVLLTGATGGLGHAIARRLRAEGAQLILTGRRADVLEKLAEEIGAQWSVVDLVDPAAVEALAHEHAAVDVLVANAALPASGSPLSFTVEELDRAIAVNLRTPIVLARIIGERLAARGSGHLLFVSSLAGKVATPGSAVYSATKFGLRGFALGLREDLRDQGVGVSVVSPGFVREAGMFHESGAQMPLWVGTTTPKAVVDAIVNAIEHNRAEIDVAPIVQRAGVRLSGLAPELVATVNRRLGAHKIADDISNGQTEKR